MKKDIYVIKNKINDKVYVGQSIDAENRFAGHCKKSSDDGSSLISKAIQKYGAENFWVEVIEGQIENYNDRERYWIKHYNSIQPNGYNIQEGGEEPPVHFSTDHPLSKFNNKKDVDLIKKDLRETSLSLNKIAKKYGVSKRTVSRINHGDHYCEHGEAYPIRKEPNLAGKLTDEQVREIIHTLGNTYRQYEDISRQYGISISAVKQINSGTCHPLDGIKYPIRKYKNSGKPACTYDQVTEISNLLMKSKMSCRKIADKFNVDLQTIYTINNGHAKRYVRDEYTYPLRKRNPIR